MLSRKTVTVLFSAEEAEAMVREAVGFTEGTDNVETHGWSNWNLAEVLRMTGKTDESIDAYRRAMERWERKGNLVQVDRCRAIIEELTK